MLFQKVATRRVLFSPRSQRGAAKKDNFKKRERTRSQASRCSRTLRTSRQRNVSVEILFQMYFFFLDFFQKKDLFCWPFFIKTSFFVVSQHSQSDEMFRNFFLIARKSVVLKLTFFVKINFCTRCFHRKVPKIHVARIEL